MRTTLLLFLLLTCYFQGSSQKSTVLKEIEKLYRHDALYWAEDSLKKLIPALPKEDLGNAYQLLAEISNDAGFTRQFGKLADSMYLAKMRVNPKPIWYVEYASYKMRFLATDRNYAPAHALSDSADQVLSDNLQDAYLIDTVFFRVNQMNIIRNSRLRNKHGDEDFYEYKRRKYPLYLNAVENATTTNPFKKAMYYRFLGNYVQDLTRANRGVAFETRKWAKKTCVSHYQKARQLIIDTLGYPNNQASLMSMLIALQEDKTHRSGMGSIKDGIALYEEALRELQVDLNGELVYHHILVPQYTVKWLCNTRLKTNHTPSLLKTIEELQSTDFIRRYYKARYFEENEEHFKESYSTRPGDDLVAVIRLLEKSKQDSLAYLVWDYQSSRYALTALYEQIKKFTPHFDSLNTVLTSIQKEYFITLDKLFLARHGFETDQDEKGISAKCVALKRKYEQILKDAGDLFKAFQYEKAPFSLPDFQKLLPENSSVLMYNSRYVFGIKKDSTIIVKLVQPSQRRAKRLGLQYTNNYETLEFNWLKGEYTYLFKPLEDFVAGSEHIYIGKQSRTQNTLFEALVTNEESTSFSNADFLLQQYRFSYFENIHLALLSEKYTGKKKAVLNGICESSVRLPFNEALVEKRNLKDGIDLTLSNQSFDQLHILAHGNQADELSGMHYYYSQEKVNDNHLMICEDQYSIQAFDSLDIRADLVVLASCLAGTGYSDQSDGIFDFTRIFTKNGSKNVISSPFVLDDQTTAMILESFYTHLDEGLGAAEALQQAKINFLKQIEDPYLYHPKYWAGLRLNGGIKAYKNKKDRFSVYYAFLLLPILGLVYRLFYRKKLAA